MLELKNIVKDYPAGNGKVHALRGIDLQFRESEFVAILGQSGCGKTTMLNIIGGLDKYTSGDLVINGRSTKHFKDRDWDAYRNHSIGFVFQSYNLIPHQSVLQNVELALALSGVSRSERRKRAKAALESVGLGDQLRKRPMEMSGGQMQRVAIARALVNDPDIILADEPTGALDSETSVQIMEILKEVAKDRLVIMVTHNPELADAYATRTIRMLDGKLLSDSNPISAAELIPLQEKDLQRLGNPSRAKKPSLRFGTSFMLSLNNLFTKKGRTMLTSFAGSIGIIGIALILALSTGINAYINQVQEDTLSSYPIQLEAESLDMTSLMVSMMGAQHGSGTEHDLDKVYSSTVMYDMIDAMMNADVTTNNLKAFKEFLENGSEIADLATIVYSYNFDFAFYTQDADGVVIKSDASSMMMEAMNAMYGGDYSSYFNSMGSSFAQFDVWEELLPGNEGELISDTVYDQYDLLYGNWPKNYDEVILFVDSHNEISDIMLYSLGLISTKEMNDAMNSMANGNAVKAEQYSWTYEELCGIQFKMLLPAEHYQKDLTGKYTDMTSTSAGMDYLWGSDSVGTKVKIVGIARPSEEASSGMVSGAIGYTSALTDYAIQATLKMDIVKEQMKNPTIDVMNGLPFATGEEKEPTAEEIMTAVTEYVAGLTAAEKAALYTELMCIPSQAYIDAIVEQQMGSMTREDIETLIVEQYAAEMGVSADTIREYIGKMSDKELFGMMEEAIAAQVIAQYAQAMAMRLSSMSIEQLSYMMDTWLNGDAATLAPMGMAPLTEAQYAYIHENHLPATLSDSSYEENLDILGYVDPESPSTISIYATTFADKDRISELIAEYNKSVKEEDQIEYTDYVALLMSSITAIISGISYLLIAFVSISLVVSSIMIGVITLISVQERTKEIGILRAIGASKKNVSGMFNAETVIIGLCAGLVGIGVSFGLTFPINAILYHFTEIAGLKAVLPWEAAVILVLISAGLTLFAGLIPSRSAAKKDPVVALRSE